MEAQLYMSENDSALQYAPARRRFYYGSLKFNWALGVFYNYTLISLPICNWHL